MKILEIAQDVLKSIRPEQVISYTCDSHRQALYVAKQTRQLLHELGSGGTMTVTVKDNVLYVGEKQDARVYDKTKVYKDLLREFMLDTNNEALFEKAFALLEEQ